VFAALETLDVADFTNQSQGIAGAGSGSVAKQRGFWSVFDQPVARLVEVGFAFLTSGDVIDEMVNTLSDLLSPDRTGEGIAAKSNELFGVLAVESGTAVIFQDGSNRLDASVHALIREDKLLEQGVDSLVVELGAWENLADGRIVGPQQGAQLILLAIDLPSQIAGSAGAESSSQQVGILR
jgi:hypothetical protein